MIESIHFSGLSYSYPGKRVPALDAIELQIPKSSIFALLGPNGAGKTTLLRILCGRIPQFQGSLQIPAEWKSPQGILDPKHYGVLIENPGVYARLSVREYLAFFGGFYAMPDLHARIDFLAHQLHFRELNHKMSALSLGMRQKVQIMRAFLHNPALVLLDEPSANLDPIAREQMWNLVTASNREFGTTFIICSHLLTEMESHCTDMGFLRKGKVVASGSLQSILGATHAKTRVEIQLGSVQTVSLASIAGVEHLQQEGSQLHFQCDTPQHANPQMVQALVSAGIPVVEVKVHRPNLAEIYRHYVEDHLL